MMHLADVVFFFKVLIYTRWNDGAETLRLCIKYNTFLNGEEQLTFRFMKYYPEVEKKYEDHRYRYAYYLLKEKIKGNKEAVEWHENY